MLTIALESIEFFAYHGYYEEERILGNNFILDIAVKINPAGAVEHLSETVNYMHLYNIAKQVMEIPQPLLEEVVADISNRIKERHPEVLYSSVSLRKLAPPMGAAIKNSLVRLEKDYLPK
ncbi:dihydroneopterin aldolase [Chitinophaga caeni]|uniref:dihydroneopterin aldolase n=1 Tax=Chitinophaga caeni TaxID=2029983 RepID=A0A291QVI1_9BACT|nr:dihydroneopterin aldolase [Chitinophaga caeni]ATL47873.1 dihydroneopterin aldolase [Chitinophaga caeni]